MENPTIKTSFAKLIDFIRDWKYFLQNESITSSLPKILHEIAILPLRHLRFYVFARSLSEPLPNFHPKLDLDILPIQEANLGQVCAIDRPSMAKLCARRLALGQKGLIAYYQGRPIGYAWGCAEVFPQMERVPIKLEFGDMLCTDVYTVPSFRGKGVQTALSQARFLMFRELGFLRAVCYIEVRNAPSIKVWQRKLNGQKIGYIDFLRIGSWYRVRYYATNNNLEMVHWKAVK